MRFRVFLPMMLTFFTAKAQDSIWVKQVKVGEAILFEKWLSPTVRFLDQSVSVGEDFYPLNNKYKVTKPIIAQRTEGSSLPLYAQYYFTPKDSIIRLVSYDWEKDEYGNFFDKKKIWEREVDSIDVYNQKYEAVRVQLNHDLGNPTKTDLKPRKHKSDRGN
jgi:hypothetical protein